MTGIGEKIKAHRERLGWTTTKLATLSGIAQSFLWRIENGRSTGSWETYTNIAKAMGVPINSLLPSSGSNVEPAHIGYRRIPVLDYVQAGKWRGVIPNSGDEEMQEFILTDLEHPAETFSLRIRGDSMEPRFAEGDVVVIDPTLQPRPGDFVVATEESGEAVFKKFRSVGKNQDGRDVFELLSLNPMYESLRSDWQKIAIVGVMVEHRQYRKK